MQFPVYADDVVDTIFKVRRFELAVDDGIFGNKVKLVFEYHQHEDGNV
jgi:hypothetical protein